MSKAIGDFVKDAREQLGLSQRALARKAKVSPTAINRLESGQSVPETTTLEAIASALQIPLTTLMGILQGRKNKAGKDSLMEKVENLPKAKRELVEAFIRLLDGYSIE